MGLQVTCGVHPQVAQEALAWGVTQAFGRDISLASHKGSKIVEGHLMGDHIHICFGIPPKCRKSDVVWYLKGKSAIQIARKFGDGLGSDENFVWTYITQQEEDDERYDQMKRNMG